MRTISNPKRGCGHLSKGAVYLRQDLVPGGLIPAFVRFAQPLPYPEGHFRGVKFVPGLLMRMGWPIQEVPMVSDGYQAMYAEAWINAGHTAQAAETELGRHIQRLTIADCKRLLAAGFAGRSVAEYPHLDAHDLLMWVGENYYPTPEKFIQECCALGINKRIPLAAPPTIVNARTMLFVAHPRAIETQVPTGEEGETETSYIPGIIGFAYLTGVIYVKPDDERAIPSWVKDAEALGQIEVVEAGPPLDAQGNEIKKATKGEPDPVVDIPLGFGARLVARVGALFKGGGEEKAEE